MSNWTCLLASPVSLNVPGFYLGIGEISIPSFALLPPKARFPEQDAGQDFPGPVVSSRAKIGSHIKHEVRCEGTFLLMVQILEVSLS